MLLKLNSVTWLLLLLGAAYGAEEQECGLFLAVSSTSTVDDPKWGMYAGKAYSPKDQIGFPEIAIQTFNLTGSATMSHTKDRKSEVSGRMATYLEQFFWVPVSSGGQFELQPGKTITSLPGPGALGAYNKRLTNSDWNHSSSYFRPAIGEVRGVTHPGRGAQSHFFNVQLSAKTAIPVGMEIFINYGDSWGADDEEEEEKLTKDDHIKIDETVDKMIAFFDKYKDELDTQLKTEIYDFLVKDVMGAAAGGQKGRKITDLLPSSADELPKVKEAGGSLMYAEPTSHRSLDWLRTYGRCMDNIRPGASTLPHAGRGAFATRKIPKGGLVAPAPLVQIFNSAVLNMYPIERGTDENGDGYYYRLSNDLQGQQLLLNYCYGHPESTMVFWPAGAGVNLINHHAKKANAKLTWSSHSFHRKHWFDMKPETLVQGENQFLGLLMEVVATRDIKEGEEVLIDYGKEWQEAWDAHVQQWDARVKTGDLPKHWPLRALDLNDEYRSRPFKTPEEVAKEPYPDGVDLKCFLVVRVPTTEEGIPKEEDGMQIRVWTQPKDGTVVDGENLASCSVLERIDVPDAGTAMPFNYTVRWGDDTDYTIVQKVPHGALVFTDKPGTSDMFVKKPFRHYIGIPDDIFPQGPWRNVPVAK